MSRSSSRAENDQQPLSKQRRIDNALRGDSRGRLPSPSSISFSRLPPDVVVSHILPHVVVLFDVANQNSSTSDEHYHYHVPLTRSLISNDPQENSDIICFGRFVRDVFRHPWFIFRSLVFTDPSSTLFRLVAVDSLKLITLGLVNAGGNFLKSMRVGSTLSAETLRLLSIPFPPCLPLLENLRLDRVGFLESLSSRRAFPSLRFLSFRSNPSLGEFDILRITGYEKEPSEEDSSDDDEEERLLNCRSLRTLRLEGSSQLSQRILDSLPCPDSLRSICLRFFPSSIARFSMLTTLDLLLIPSLMDSSKIERFVALPCLRDLVIDMNIFGIMSIPSADQSYVRRFATWILPSLRSLELRYFPGAEVLLGEWEEMIADSLVRLVIIRSDHEDEETDPDNALKPSSMEWPCLQTFEVSYTSPNAFLGSGVFPVLSKLTLFGTSSASLMLGDCDLPSLTHLCVEGGSVDAELFSSRHSFDHLETLILRCSIVFVGDRRSDFEWGVMRSIRSLRLNVVGIEGVREEASVSNSYELMEFVLVHSASVMKHLRLSFWGDCSQLEFSLGSLSALEKLDISGDVTDAILMSSSRYMTSLSIFLENDEVIGDLGNVIFPRLTSVNLSCVSSLQDEFFQLTDRFPCLKSIVLSELPQICGKDWCVFPQLTHLRIQNLNRLCLYSLFEDPPTPRFPSLESLVIGRCGALSALRGEAKTDPRQWGLREGCRLSVENCPAATPLMRGNWEY